jgi:hypothetical protein
MELLTIIVTVIATLVGIIAGIVQVVQYFQERKKNGRKSNKLEQPAEPQPSPRKQIKYNLPHPDYKKFIGREHEIENIISILCHDALAEVDIITIHGVGGIGKSALAIEVAYRLYHDYEKIAENQRFDAIIWASPRRSVYTGEKIVSFAPTEKILGLIYINIATTLNHPEILKLNHSEQREAIRNLLTQQRTLLIVDNVDEFEEEQELLAFLSDLPEPTKVIATTRHPIIIDYAVHLTEMSSKDARALIRSERDRRHISISKVDLRELHKKTWGIPLAIVLTIAQIADGYEIQSILNILGTQKDNIAKYCFENALERIRNTEAWKILLALSMFPAGTKKEVVALIAEVTEEQLDADLIKLTKLSLINQTTPGIYWMLPLINEYIQDKFPSFPEEVISRLRHNFAKAYMNIKIESAEAAKGFIHAVHLAIDLSDLLAWDTRIAEYLSANQKAIERGVKIIRIFVLDKQLTYLDEDNSTLHPLILEILNEQLRIGIDVRILWRDAIEKNRLVDPPDMINFDGQELHLHKGHGGMYDDAIISKDADEIDYWEKQYARWAQFGVKWSDIRRQ